MKFFIVLFSFIPVGLLAQKKVSSESYYTETNGGLCSKTIVLYSDSTYCSESGCEKSSHISFGKWEIKKDIVKITPVDTKTFKILGYIDSTKVPGSSLSVKILDKNGINITQKILIGQKVPTKGIYSLDLDTLSMSKKGLVRDSSLIVLKSLQILLQQPIQIPTNGNNNFIINLNISGGCIYNTYADWQGPESIEFIKQKDKLITLLPDQFGNDGILKRTEFLRSK